MDTMKVNPFHTTDVKELAIDGTTVTSTATELNIMDGITASVAELNKMDGVDSIAVTVGFGEDVKLFQNNLSSRVGFLISASSLFSALSFSILAAFTFADCVQNHMGKVIPIIRPSKPFTLSIL